tara:strand:- start:22899 stop:23441 length:543 start_codon:yes stop_codon:yes gene_type:complete
MKNLTKLKMNEQQGFTLIELVVVIVILGILAVTAAPKFINLQDDARTATLQAVKASMQSAASLVYSKSLIKGNESSAGSATTFVNVNGTDVFVRYGYPRDNNAAALANWQNDLLDLNTSEFTVTRANGAIIINPADVPLSGSWPTVTTAPQTGNRNCYVRYQESDVAGDGPLLIEVAPCL